MIKRRNNVVLVAVALVIVVVYAVLVIHTNINANNAIYKDYSIGEKFSYKGCEGTVKGAQIYTIDELKKKYDLENYVAGYDLEENQIRVCVVDIDICKKQEIVAAKDNEDDIDMDTIGIDFSNVTLVTKSYSATTDYTLSEMLNKDEKLYADIGIGEKISMKFPYMLTQPSVRKSVMDNIKEEDIWILLDDYDKQRYNIKVKVNGDGITDSTQQDSTVSVSNTKSPIASVAPTKKATDATVKTPQPTQTKKNNPTQEELLDMDIDSCNLVEVAIGQALNDDKVKKYVEENNITTFKIRKLEDATGDPLSEKVVENIKELVTMGFPQYSEPKSDIGKNGEGVYIFEWKTIGGEIQIKSGTNEFGNKQSDILYTQNTEYLDWFDKGVEPVPDATE